MCIMDVNATAGINNYHVAGHNAQTVATDIETILALETDPERKELLQAILHKQQVITDDLMALWGRCHCAEDGNCEHDHRRSIEGQPGDNQKIAEQRLEEIKAEIRAETHRAEEIEKELDRKTRPGPAEIHRSIVH